MAVYRFRVTFEDTEDVYREIDIKSSQNFEDFHNIIIQSIGFDNIHDASFYISDDYWRKGEEITLQAEKEASTPKKQMNKCKLLSLIDDPHQKFVYVYDLKTNWTFLVELMKIVPDDEKASYPKCIKNVGEAPKQYKTNTAVPVVDEDEIDEDEEKGKLIDAMAYTAGTEDEDTALLEGEEGDDDDSTNEEEDDLSNEFEEEEESGRENYEED